ncbi:MAG: hypothetical protein LBP92_06520 [Deltaproteobacteria bacterium]|nr:hypothetical protein [Deltaproteobacteria bacterium]
MSDLDRGPLRKTLIWPHPQIAAQVEAKASGLNKISAFNLDGLGGQHIGQTEYEA